MITENSSIRRSNPQDIITFLNSPIKHDSVNNRYERVASSHKIVKNILLEQNVFECESFLTDDNFGYSEDYLFYLNKDENYTLKLNIRSSDQWQTYSRSIYKPSTLLDYNKLVDDCKENLDDRYKNSVVTGLFLMMRTAQQNYNMYVDGDSSDFMFSIENNRKFSKLTFEFCSNK